MSIYEDLRTRWVEAGIPVNDGVPRVVLDQFEEKHNVSLPVDFKHYLQVVNGMEEGQVDEHLLSFLSLEAIDKEINHKEFATSEVSLVVAEYSIFAHWYVLGFSRCVDRSLVF